MHRSAYTSPQYLFMCFYSWCVYIILAVLFTLPTLFSLEKQLFTWQLATGTWTWFATCAASRPTQTWPTGWVGAAALLRPPRPGSCIWFLPTETSASSPPFPWAGAGDAAALRRLARLLGCGVSTLPGRLQRGRQKPRGRESAADGLRQGLCGHCAVSGGARNSSGGQRQGETHLLLLYLYLCVCIIHYKYKHVCI